MGIENYSSNVDIWSIGAIIAEMAKGDTLFQGEAEWSLMCNIFQRFGTPDPAIWKSIGNCKHFDRSYPNFEPTGKKLSSFLKSLINRT